MRVRYNSGARADLDQILTYISERNPLAAARMLERFRAAERLLGLFPEMGARTSRKPLRRTIVGKYVMAYTIDVDVITIHYICHGARKRPWENE